MAMPQDARARCELAYNNAADFYDHASNSFWSRFGQRTIDRLGLVPGARILDLCCGSGASAIPAAVQVGAKGHVLAVDLAEELLRIGRQKATRLGIRHLEFRVADLLTLNPVDGEFDAVVCVFGLFFLPDMAAGLRHMWSLVNVGGCLAITTWGNGLFEPINSYFWDEVRAVRPKLFKAFNPWDRLGEPPLVTRLFAEAGLPDPEVVPEPGAHSVQGADGVRALLLGTGYRGTLEQLSSPERARVVENVLYRAGQNHVLEVGADVIYATCRKA